MKLTTVGPAPADDTLLNEVDAALRGLQGEARLVIAYLPITASHARMMAGLASIAGGVPVIGASTGGAAFTERGASNTGAAIGILTGDVAIPVQLVTGLKAAGADAVAQAATKLATEWKAAKGGRYAMMILADAYACDGEALAEALRRAVPTHCKIFGGTAGDGFQFDGTKIFHGRNVHDDAALVVLLPTPPSFDVQGLHGFEVAAGSREMELTKIDGNVLHEIDGRPAREVYAEELERLGLFKPGDDLLTAMAINELGLRTVMGDERLKIRTPLGIDGDSVTLGGSLSQGTLVRVVRAEPEQLIAAASELSKRMTRPGSLRRGALVFDCSCRWQLLGERYGEQVAAFGSEPASPFLGFASYGEFAKSGGSLSGYHNTTAVMAAW